jgi:hypothetical protein
VLGVNEFQSKYFGGNALYLDEEKAFYSFLGSKNIFTLGGLGKARALSLSRTRRANERVARVRIEISPPRCDNESRAARSLSWLRPS